jgi:pilus assembly protein CpaF
MSELKSAAAKWTARAIGEGAAGQEDRMRPLTPAEREWKESIYNRLLKVLDLSLLATVEDTEARRQIREVCENLITEERAPLSVASRQTIIRRIEDEVLGLGPLEPRRVDKSGSDILVNGSPMVDARLKDGSRVNAIIPPLALDGAVLSIRRFAVELLSIDDLIRLGSLTSAVAQAMAAIVKARLNVVVSGGTGAGKTTLLNLLSGFIPANERIVTIEDSAELQMQQPHVVRLETRPPNIEGRGAVTQRDLVRNSLRMRPDRIVLGEVRGGEALDMLQAMNTGHDGSLTTIHANTPRDALGRIENMVSMTGISFPVKALRSQISSAIDIVIQVERMEDGCRRVVSVQEINGMEGDVITSTELFAFERRGVDKEGHVLGELRSTGIVPGFLKDMHARGIELPIELFRRDDDALFARR